MTFEKLFEDDQKLDQTSNDTEAEDNIEDIGDMIYHGNNGKFYFSPDGIHAEEIDPADVPRIKRWYDNWLLDQKDREDPNFDYDEYLKSEEERKNRAKEKMQDPDAANKLRRESDKQRAGEKFKLGGGGKIKKKPSKYAGISIDPSFEEIAKTIEQMAANIIEPKVRIERELDLDYDWRSPDPYDSIDDDISTYTQDYDPHDVEYLDETSEKPFVLFYFDCSGSCQGPGFIKLGQRLVGLMQELENQDKIICKDLYFDTDVHEKFFHGGGTSGEAVVRDINKITENGKKIANVILFTDTGCDDASSVANINGNVCFVFIDIPGNGIQDHIRSISGDVKTFLYTSDSAAKA